MSDMFYFIMDMNILKNILTKEHVARNSLSVILPSVTEKIILRQDLISL